MNFILIIHVKQIPRNSLDALERKKVLTTIIGPLVLKNGKHTDSEIQMTENLNDYFASIFATEKNSEYLPHIEALSNTAFLSTCTLKEKESLDAINEIKIKKTPRPDKISPRILKEDKNELTKPLSILLKKSLNIRQVLDEWKLGNVTPIF